MPEATVPLREAPALPKGRGSYTMQFGNYASIPQNVLGPLLLRLRGY